MKKANIFKMQRMASGLTQFNASYQTGISTTHISFIENGLREPTNAEIDIMKRVYEQAEQKETE